MTKIVFADVRVKTAFDQLQASKTEQQLYEAVLMAIKEIEQTPSAFIHIPQRLIPKEYVKKYRIDNLWKYDLPDGWRLLYSPAGDGVEIIAIVLEWMDHKKYERGLDMDNSFYRNRIASRFLGATVSMWNILCKSFASVVHLRASP